MLDGQWTFISNRGGFGDDEKGRRQTFPCVKRIPKPISCWPLCSQRRILPPLAGQTYRLRPFRGVGVSNNLFRAVGFVEHFSTFEAIFQCRLPTGRSIYPSIHISAYFFNLKMMLRQRGKCTQFQSAWKGFNLQFKLQFTNWNTKQTITSYQLWIMI